MRKKAIIIGAGPAGLTAAYELLTRTDIIPVILERSGDTGGLSKTVECHGNRMDMGPHRFFSKSDRVMQWWLRLMPLVNNSDTANGLLLIPRLTRIYFLRQFFSYPLSISVDTIRAFGWVRALKILFSFLWAKVNRRKEKNLEDVLINKFGRQLYGLFFEEYTKKVWGVPGTRIAAEWGTLRIKGLTLGKAVRAALTGARKGPRGRQVETSLIDEFFYPRYGAGSMWEEVANQVLEMGGEIHFHQTVQTVYALAEEVCSVHVINTRTGELTLFSGEYFFSTMPVRDLILGMAGDVPAQVREIAAGLQYRDLIVVGVLLKRLTVEGGLKDNWIYIQEPGIRTCRITIYNNWGGSMVNDPETVWIGMEYSCSSGDDLWSGSDAVIGKLAVSELVAMELTCVGDVLDLTVRRATDSYPAYFGSYGQFGEIRNYTDRLLNLFLIGRNGMHKYNNSDHSMLTAMVAVDNILAGVMSKDNIWAVNTEQEYHEKAAPTAPADGEPLPSATGEPPPSAADVLPAGSVRMLRKSGTGANEQVPVPNNETTIER